MKLIKKMLAIMFAFMMVVGMGTKVNAEGETGETQPASGSITINNAVKDQTYSIYKILELESYDKDNDLYSYKPVDAWKKFFQVEDVTAGQQKGAGSDYVTIDENGYATWIAEINDANKATFAKLALEYAKTNGINNNEKKNAEGSTVTFGNLPLGYYLVDSSVGALCNLTTTASTATINEKNGTPTVEKKVSNTANGNYSDSNFANIGDTVYFQTSITAQPGAQNYVLHDTMSDGLTFDESSISVNLKKKGEQQTKTLDSSTDYVLNTSGLVETGTICTFHIEFTKVFCDSLSAGDQIIVSYSATLNENAVVGNAGNKNDTWLKYGNGTDTTHSITTTKTYEIPVFKYTGNNTPLAGASFALYYDEVCTNRVNLIKSSSGENYHLFISGDEDAKKVLTVTTNDTGSFNITGLKAGTYYLKEIEASKGYNKLASPIKVEINDDGTLKIGDKDKIDGASITQVNVENKTGTLLPSTGGMGTTIIYMAGAILVIASGIVLVSKKKSKAK